MALVLAAVGLELYLLRELKSKNIDEREVVEVSQKVILGWDSVVIDAFYGGRQNPRPHSPWFNPRRKAEMTIYVLALYPCDQLRSLEQPSPSTMRI
jgi:hypothetical protein